jgi:hypothetical protein
MVSGPLGADSLGGHDFVTAYLNRRFDLRLVVWGGLSEECTRDCHRKVIFG